MSDKIPNPWHDQAEYLLPDSVVPASHRNDVVIAISKALALAYEYGYAQGRIAEVEYARALDAPRGTAP